MARFIALPTILTAAACFLLAASPADAQFQVEEKTYEAYMARWGPREKVAQSSYARRNLAENLIAAAKAPGVENDMVALLCARAYHFARQDRPNYALGAQAAELMARSNPELTVDAMSRVRDLYKAAYQENPAKNLGMGIGLAQATARLAEQRLMQLEHADDAEGASIETMLREINRAIGEYGEAGKLAGSVITRARATAQRLEKRQPDLAADLLAFCDEHGAVAADIDAASADAGKLRTQMITLLNLNKQFESTQSADAARQLGEFYIVHLDSPARAMPYAKRYLSAEEQGWLKLAARPVSSLTPDDALALGGWYGKLAAAAEGDYAVPMALKAKRFYLRCDGAFEKADARFATARDGLAKVQTILAGHGFKEATPLLKPSDYTPPAPPPVTPTPTPPRPTPTPTPTPPRPETPYEPELPSRPNPEPEPSVELRPGEIPGIDPPAGMTRLPDGGYLDSAGRRIYQCQKCYLKFSPRRGEATDRCPSCARGSKSIFDFGEE